jgi:RNA polymerase sigma-70 factor (ECF subfamily)
MKPEATDALRTRPSLLSAVRRGDEDAWTEFYTSYRGYIYTVARGAGLSNEESEDVVQETMVAAKNHVGSFVPDRRRARFRTWLRTIVRSRVIDCHRRKSHDPLLLPNPGAGGSKSDSTGCSTSTVNRLPDPKGVEVDQLLDRSWEQSLLAEARERAKKEVSMRHYQAYYLLDVREISNPEAAKSLGVSMVTVRVWAFRVRRVILRLMRQIEKEMEERGRQLLADQRRK